MYFVTDFRKYVCFHMVTFTQLDIFICRLDYMNIDLHETVNFKFEKKKSVE